MDQSEKDRIKVTGGKARGKETTMKTNTELGG
jgi:hypothetical protein